MATKLKEGTYSVRLKISLQGYKNKFYEGIAIAHNPERAKEIAMGYTERVVRKSNPGLPKFKIEALKCIKVRDDFFINEKGFADEQG